ncbi:alpha/beta fold hydrolase [Lewinella sp. W8]|uniref:alpha/beta fold hydrolase n=1 Tax=Lewinella sp. W8 TaxID=2528208 RepID=UPI001068C8BE|nr:alpha/beta hydrolase [Lewinella sp. W8]MTB50254.1 alpha/beta fold hydrolase [Lewinella sp. W8]
MEEYVAPELEEWYRQGHETEILNHRVFYRREGAGIPLLCIHGFPTSSWDFAPLWRELTATHDVIAADLLGLGRSEKPGTITVMLQADVLVGLCESLGIKEFRILAHDLGDTVAQELLARFEEGSLGMTIRSCVFLNGGIFPETHRPRLIQQLLLSPLGPWVAQLSTERTFRRNMKNVFGRQTPPGESFLRGSWQLLIENNGRRMLPKLIHYMRERVTHRERWVGPLRRHIVPHCLINGVLDPVSGGHAADRYEELIPDAKVFRLPVGHYPHVERPEAVGQLIKGFHETIS